MQPDFSCPSTHVYSCPSIYTRWLSAFEKCAKNKVTSNMIGWWLTSSNNFVFHYLMVIESRCDSISWKGRKTNPQVGFKWNGLIRSWVVEARLCSRITCKHATVINHAQVPT
jgi:hypothetical protein